MVLILAFPKRLLSAGTLVAILVPGIHLARLQEPQQARAARAIQSDDFQLEPPKALSQLAKKSVWFTDYIDYLVDEDTEADAVPLMDERDSSLEVSLKRREWCKAANEGTITVKLANGRTRSFNYAGRLDHPVTDCADVLTGFEHSAVAAINRSAFSELPDDAQFGLGVKNAKGNKNYRLVPARSIAIDLKGDGQFHLGQVLYIPQLRNVKVLLPDGRTVFHDGYVMAADRVSACSGSKGMPADCNKNHLDYFIGRSRSDKLPSELVSDPSHTFDAYLVSDPSVIAKLAAEHDRE